VATDALDGRTIAIAESRELDVFAGLLERRGGRVLRYPLVRIIDAPDPAPVLSWLRAFNGGGCDDLILLTGEGLRRLLRCIERHEPALRPPFLERLAVVRKITRGPKPARVLRELGLKPDIEAELPTTAGVITTLRQQNLAGRRVGVQLYGEEPNKPLLEFLREAGARPLPVAPYAYAPGASDIEVRGLLERMTRREIDAIAFTSKAQVERLFEVGDAELVRRALEATAVAVVGPVVADTLASHGVNIQAMPAQSWFLKPLTAELVALLGGHETPGAGA
jgi:uroporphyrinogen-III synthase